MWKEIEDRIVWDFKLGDEFKANMAGKFAFIVDVYDGVAKLALYKIKKYSSESNPVKSQPPMEMLHSAVQKEGGDLGRGGIFNISQELKDWIKENYFEK